MEALVRRAFECLKRFPQLFIFPLVCLLAQSAIRRLFGGLIRLDFAYQPFGLPVPPAVASDSLTSLIFSLVFAFFSAGQVFGLLLAVEAEQPLTFARFRQATARFGGRVLVAKLLRAGAFTAITLVGAVLALLLKGLAVLLILIAIAVVAIATAFWELLIVRENLSPLAALRRTIDLAARETVNIAGTLIIVSLAGGLGSALLGQLPVIGATLAAVFRAAYGAFAGLVLLNLLRQVTATRPVARRVI